MLSIRCPVCGKKNRIPLERLGEQARCGECKEPLPMGAWEADHPVSVSGDDLQRLLRSSRGLVLVDFWAPWCGPCRFMNPVLERLAEKYSGELLVLKLNVDENPQTAAQYRIQGVPTMILAREGRIVDQIVGALPAPQLEQRIVQLLGSRTAVN